MNDVVMGIVELGGWMLRELLIIFDGLVGFKVVGVDVVEVVLVYDGVGEIMGVVVVEVVYFFLYLMVKILVVGE